MIPHTFAGAFITLFMSYYAVVRGRSVGVFLNWDECRRSVYRFKNALYKKFDTEQEAREFVRLGTMCITNELGVQSCSTLHDTMISVLPNESIKTNTSIMFAPDYCVYTDGSCLNNGSNTASAGIGIYFGEGDIRNVSKVVKGKQTNNVAEVTAIIEAYYLISSDVKNGMRVMIVSDSEYAIRCATTYGFKCDKHGWVEDVPNKQLVKAAYELYKNIPNVRFMHVRSHTNKVDVHSIGNYNADILAKAAVTSGG